MNSLVKSLITLASFDEFWIGYEDMWLYVLRTMMTKMNHAEISIKFEVC